jgi:hypothetical protein
MACVAFAGAYGFAASLGLSPKAFGATSNTLASCGPGMRFRFTTAFHPGISGYAVDRIDLSNIPAGCLDKSLTATFYRGDDNVRGSAISVTLPSSGTTETVSVDPNSNLIDASHVSGVSVVVS